MEPVVHVENASKRYSRNADSHLSYGVSDLFRELLGRKSAEGLRADEFLAVNDISFSLFKGDTFALIGRNGSGKTTLLKMMTGLTKPDAGRICIHGRVQALINLGAGFNPKLSGRENIFNSAALMGMTRKETNSGVVDEIIEFSELDEFIDSPVYTYSSGMKSRLGFSVAVSLKPEILFIDEILSVGDYAFQNRCFARMQQLKKKGVTIVLVSHAHNSVIQLCDKALWMHQGKPMFMGPSKEAVKAYLEFLENSEAQRVSSKNAAARAVAVTKALNNPDGSRTLLETTFGESEGLPAGWHPSAELDVETGLRARGEDGLNIEAPRGDLAVGFEYFLPDVTTHLGETIEIMLEAMAEEPERLGINFYFDRNGRTSSYTCNHPGDGSWTTLGHKVTLPKDADPESLRLLIRLRPGATRPAAVRSFLATVRPAETPSTAEQTEAAADPHDGLYGPIHPTFEAIDRLSIEFLTGDAEVDSLPMHQPLTVAYAFTLLRHVEDLNVTLKFFRKDGLHLSTVSTLNGDLLHHHHEGRVSCACTIQDFYFTPGTYVLVIAVHEGKSYLYRDVVKEFAVTGSGRFAWGITAFHYDYEVDGKVVYKTREAGAAELGAEGFS